MLKNYMEQLVDLYVPRIFLDNPEQYARVCQCDECITKIKIEALNHLKPFYVTSLEGEVYGEYSACPPQERADLIQEIAKAIETVRVSAHTDPDTALRLLLQSKVKQHEREAATRRKEDKI